MRILIADDSKTSLALLSSALKMLGHEVIATKSGAEAIASYLNEKPDLIILDVLMEEIDGYECAKKIREIESEDWIPIIFLSSSIDDDSIAKGIYAGGDDYLTKPFSQVTLAAKIKAMQRISNMRKKLYETTCKLSLLSSTDTLTGLYNRLQFNKTFSEKISYAKRHHKLLALLFVDLDNFKFINDHYGHHIGDLLLKEMAEQLRACMREYDFIARLGGDEFAIIIDDIKIPEDGGSVAQNILDVLSHSYNIENHNFTIGCSIGIACYPISGTDQELLARNADIAMYHAKELGRNNFQYFTNELFEKYTQQDQLKNALKDIIKKNELTFLYDPIFNLKTRKITGVEIVLRWKHPKFGLILPHQFLPLTEAVGLTSALEYYVLRKACEQGQQWHAAGYDQFNISVDISYLHLLQKEFPTHMQSMLAETQLPTHLLTLKISLNEPKLMIFFRLSEKVMNELSNMGIAIVIDDFGIGHSSLSNLKKLPVKGLKINKSFITDINFQKQDAMIVKSIIDLGKDLNLDVIAEGIETEQQLQFLLENYCPKGQGTFLSDSLEPEQVMELLKESK